jgi:hypothetical protein
MQTEVSQPHNYLTPHLAHNAKIKLKVVSQANSPPVNFSQVSGLAKEELRYSKQSSQGDKRRGSANHKMSIVNRGEMSQSITS